MIDVHKLRSKKNNIIATSGVAVVLLILSVMGWNAWKPSRTLTWSDRVEAYAFARDFYKSNPGYPGTETFFVAFLDECLDKRCHVLPRGPGEGASMSGTDRAMADYIIERGINISTPKEPQKRGLLGGLSTLWGG